MLTRGQCFFLMVSWYVTFTEYVVDNIAGIFAFPSHRALLCCNNNQGTLLLCKHCIHYNRIGMLYIGTLQWVVIGELVAKAVCTGPVGLGNSKSSLDSALRKDLRHSIRSKHVHTAAVRHTRRPVCVFFANDRRRTSTTAKRTEFSLVQFYLSAWTKTEQNKGNSNA